MPLIGIIGGLILGFAVATWATVKLVIIALQSQDDRVWNVVNTVWTAYGLGASAFVLVEIWAGLAAWATGLWHWIGTL